MFSIGYDKKRQKIAKRTGALGLVVIAMGYDTAPVRRSVSEYMRFFGYFLI